MELSIAGRVASPQAQGKNRRLYAGLLAIALVGGFLILAWAEAVWLEGSLPRDHVARISLAAIPRIAAASPDTWTDDVLSQASHDNVLLAVIQKLDLRDDSGQPLSPAQLRQRMRFNAQCVQVLNDQGASTPGASLAVTVRGPDDQQVNSIAEAWEEAFLRASSPMIADPLSGPVAPYSACQEP